jgi:hypothetical protein
MNPPFSQKWALYASHLGSYMRRWIFKTPWGTLRIHNILKSDEGRDFHDHPFSFLSFIFRGGYIEHRPGCTCDNGVDYPVTPCRRYSAPAVVHRRAEDMHRLELAAPAWTFVISSRYFRQWGFLLSDGRWVNYKEYERSYYRGQP